MNRSVIYEYLKGFDELKSLFIKHGRGYHVEYVPEVWIKFSQVVINDWYVENFYSITLLIQEIIIRGEIGDMEIHVRYEDIDEFKVWIEEGYKVIK